MAPKALKITAKRDGFRRAGIAHPGHAVVHAPQAFTAAQVAQLQAEPMLVVEEVEAPVEGQVDAPVDAQAAASAKPPTRKAELQHWLRERGVEFGPDETLAQLTERAEAVQRAAD